jgi:hypothetical protein
MKEEHALDARYGKIGIAAVAAAVQYTAAAATSSRARAQPEKAEPEQRPTSYLNDAITG